MCSCIWLPLSRVGLDKQPRPVEQFTPMNLQWAYMKGSPTVPVLLPKMPPKLCDLAHILIPTEGRGGRGKICPELTPVLHCSYWT